MDTPEVTFTLTPESQEIIDGMPQELRAGAMEFLRLHAKANHKRDIARLDDMRWRKGGEIRYCAAVAGIAREVANRMGLPSDSISVSIPSRLPEVRKPSRNW